MRNRKFRKKGLGIPTIALMILCIAVMVLPMNVVADGTFRCVYIEYTYVRYGNNYPGLAPDDYVNGTYDGAVGTPTFEWRLDWGPWYTITNVVPLPLSGSFDFNFIMNGSPSPPGTLWIQATDNSVVTEWHCTYT